MRIEDALLGEMGGGRGAGVADRLCQACVHLLGVDGAAISLVNDGVNIATLGASDPAARSYDELQFTLGVGPCLDAVAHRAPVMIADLADRSGGSRWPAYGEAMLANRIRGVYAMPIVVAGEYVGALDVFNAEPPAWTVEQLIGIGEAAELAQIPVMDLLARDMGEAAAPPGSAAWNEIRMLTRAEVSQATGVLMAQLHLSAPAALIRLRAHAYASGRSATAVAGDVLARRLHLERN
ncbi:GAF domain-containing protein [Mycobacterium antarcticum]|uniref:GAF and ANTAR domain-containing protein n=1 Tax=Mycolicibacterium sp. TUM20985 TaxID=3023370 RepID=UPI0025745C03|nr:GAF and ANTAR domain-containing protein [Mycolicibacterium sp. TUM20985]BDX35133.1 GAF domain-containing protein [Mycolicibacterium sp. TUM20985]